MENYSTKKEEKITVCPNCAGELVTRPMQVGSEKYPEGDPYCSNCEGYLLADGGFIRISKILESKKRKNNGDMDEESKKKEGDEMAEALKKEIGNKEISDRIRRPSEEGIRGW